MKNTRTWSTIYLIALFLSDVFSFRDGARAAANRNQDQTGRVHPSGPAVMSQVGSEVRGLLDTIIWLCAPEGLSMERKT
jgi:hypothetical protein